MPYPLIFLLLLLLLLNLHSVTAEAEVMRIYVITGTSLNNRLADILRSVPTQTEKGESIKVERIPLCFDPNPPQTIPTFQSLKKLYQAKNYPYPVPEAHTCYSPKHLNPFPHSSTVVTSPEYAHNILHASRVVVIYPAVLALSSRDPIKAGLDLVRSVPSKLLSPFLTIPPRPTLVVMLEPATQNANTLGLGLLIPFQTLYPNAPTIRAPSLQKAALHTIRHALLPPLPHYPQDITILLPHIVILLAFWAAVFVLWKAGSFYVTVLQGMLAELTKEYQVNEEKDKKDKATNDATGTS